jgi:hypothetical protein
MLAQCLVNESGKRDGWIGIDLWQEHDVRVHRVDFNIANCRGPAGENLLQHVSGILHTLRAAKKEFFQKLDITSTVSQARVLRSNLDILILIRMWHEHGVVKWEDDRASWVFEAYPGLLKEEHSFINKDDVKVIRSDPLQTGLHILISGNKDLKAFLRRRNGGRAIAAEGSAERVDAEQEDMADGSEEEDEEEGERPLDNEEPLTENEREEADE